MPAPPSVNTSPLTTGLTPGLETYKATVDSLEERFGKKKRRAPRRKKFTSPEFVVTKKDLALIKEGTRLQHAHNKRSKRSKVSKKDLALIKEGARLQHAFNKRLKSTKAPKRSRAAVKSRSSSPRFSLDWRTTLLSLVRRFPDSKKPILQWLK